MKLPTYARKKIKFNSKKGTIEFDAEDKTKDVLQSVQSIVFLYHSCTEGLMTKKKRKRSGSEYFVSGHHVKGYYRKP